MEREGGRERERERERERDRERERRVKSVVINGIKRNRFQILSNTFGLCLTFNLFTNELQSNTVKPNNS
jgi:hypothetical protein